MGVTSSSPPSDAVLRHYGIKGMRWGVRRKEGADGRVSKSDAIKGRDGGRISVSESGEYTTTRGNPVSADAVVARARQTKAKHQGSDSLSTKELQELVNRMNLEKQYDGLNPATMHKGLELAMGLGKVVVPVIAMNKLGAKLSADPDNQKLQLGIQVVGALLSASGGGKKKK